jgi:hypothetical protein
MKRLFTLEASVAVLLFSLGVATAAPPETVLLSIRGTAGTKPPVGFTHKAHAETVTECNTCHHRDATASIGQKCSGCHGANDKITRVCLRQAYHRQCLGCHSKGDRGPRKCNECHT